MYNSVQLQDINREKIIKEQIDKGVDIIYIERYPNDVLWNPDAWNAFHKHSLKVYYGIDEEKTIVRDKIVYEKWMYYKKQNKYTLNFNK